MFEKKEFPVCGQSRKQTLCKDKDNLARMAGIDTDTSHDRGALLSA